MVYIRHLYPMEQYTITKRIAKHGKQAVLVIPKVLQEQLQPRSLVKVIIEVLEGP